MSIIIPKPTDIELAKAVRDAIHVLNNSIRTAHDAGLKIDITDTPHQTVSRLDPLRIYHADIWRPV